MSRRMSCSMTVAAVRDRSKTVTRRHPDTWQDLKAGDPLTLIEKGMGLPKGARQVVLAEVEVIEVTVEDILAIEWETDGTVREGLPHLTPHEFVEFWQRSHGRAETCRRIEWCYLDLQESGSDAGDNGGASR